MCAHRVLLYKYNIYIYIYIYILTGNNTNIYIYIYIFDLFPVIPDVLVSPEFDVLLQVVGARSDACLLRPSH